VPPQRRAGNLLVVTQCVVCTAVRRALFLLALSASCSADEESPATPEKRACGVVAWLKPTSDTARVDVRLGWENFAVAHEMVRTRDGFRALSLQPPAGEQLYAIVEDNVWKTDPTVPVTAFATVDGVLREVTSIVTPNCGVPLLRIDEASATPTGAATVRASFLASATGEALDPKSVRATLGEQSLAVDGLVVRTTLPPGKHRIVVRARDTAGREAESATATVWVEPRAWDWRDAVVYQIVTDRYRARDGSALPSPSPISARAGGHVDGVRRAIESGELAAMGVNTIWISPLYDNPDTTFPGLDGRQYSSYHGYWPTAARALESTVADEASVDALLTTAHKSGIRVIFDVVPNHIHQEHPYAAAHPEWFHGTRNADGTWASPCVCGTASCPWGENSLSCWFAPYMPDVDWRRLDAANTFSDDVAWFIDRFNGDGVRIDAVPLMPRSAIRRIAHRVRTRFDHPGQRTLVLGEIFTGSEGYDALRFFMGPSGLDSAFEFPLMWTLRAALAERNAPMSTIDAQIRASEQAFSGSGGVISLIVGNHDVARFASVANGDGARDGFNPAPQPTDTAIYARLGVAFGITFALPGMPTVYYGDEVGLAGGGDPDSRRVYPREGTLLPEQRVLRDRVRAFGRARGCLEPLRRGTYRALASDPERIVFAREHNGQTVIVVATRDGSGRLESPLPGIAAGEWVDVLSHEKRTFDPARSTFDEPSGSARYYVRANSACL
jgi:glycosidase